MSTTRVAEVTRRDGRPHVGEVNAYLPNNYVVTDVQPEAMWIAGEDVAGWTLDGYVIPRLASGLIAAREVTDPEVLAEFARRAAEECPECGAMISAAEDMISGEHDESCSLHPANVVTGAVHAASEYVQTPAMVNQGSDDYDVYPEDEHPADCDGTTEAPDAGFGGQPITGTCQHPSHGLTQARVSAVGIGAAKAELGLAGESKAVQDVVSAAGGPVIPAIIGHVNHGYKIIAAVPTDYQAREFVVCAVAVEDRHDQAATWRLDTTDGRLVFWSGDYYHDNDPDVARDVAMLDMLTRARLDVPGLERRVSASGRKRH